MTKGKQLLFLATITLGSIIIRFYQLGNVPNGLATDEADIGYNAYSIAKTGADVYGRKLPLFFQSLDDYKPGLVFYITIPAIAAFGLSDFSVRLAPAIFGLFIPALTFILIKLLYSQKSSAYPKTKNLPYLSAILMSFAPWNVALSRAMIQYIPLIFLYLFFFILFLFAQRETLKAEIKATALFISFLVLSLTLYIYYAAVIYLPLILVVLAYLFKDFIKKNLRIFLSAILILFIFSLPAIVHYSNRESKTRLNAISVLTADITLLTSVKEMEQDRFAGDPTAGIVHNRRFVYLQAILNNYFDYFNLDYLFVDANKIRYFYVNNVGLFYLIELPFVLYGLYILIKRRDKPDLLILTLLAIGPIPAAITLGSPLPHRALLTILSIQLISAIGLSSFISNILRAKLETITSILSFPRLLHPRSKARKREFSRFSIKSRMKLSGSRYALTIISVFILVYSVSIYFFLHQYFIHAPREFVLGGWFPVVRDAIPIVNKHMENYDKVVFTWSNERLVPPVYFLFYNKVDPKIIQSKASLWTNEPPSYRQIYNQIENIEFRPINWKEDKKLKNHLFVVYPKEVEPNTYRLISKTYLPDGKEHFLIIEPL